MLKCTPLGPVVRSIKRARFRREALHPVAAEVSGFQMLIPSRDLPRYEESFEPLTIDWVRQVVRPGLCAIDVGAALGLFSLELARLVGEGGRVIAIEPSSTSVRLLKRNARRNRAVVSVLHAAASSADGARNFYLTDSSDSHAFYPHPLIGPRKQISIKTVRLDSVAESVDFLKIDVEGAELDVLRGASQLLSRSPLLVVEWAPACQRAAGRRIDELPEFLMRLGYDLEVFDETNHVRTTVEHTLAADARGEIPLHWYANLCCVQTA